MKKFLADSCWLDPSADSTKADLAIGVTCRLSSANSDALDAGEARLEGSVVILAPRLSPPRAETENIYFEKKYDVVPYETSDRRPFRPGFPDVGAARRFFIWEANVKLREAVKKILLRL